MHMLRHRRLVWDLILVILDHVIGSTPIRQKRAIEQLWILLSGSQCEQEQIQELVSDTDLLLRKQFWMTLMMKEAASFSLKPGLNRCLNGTKETMRNNCKWKSNCWHNPMRDSLEQFDGLSSEAGQASVQHEGYQGDHSIHVGPESKEELILMPHVTHP